MTHSLNAKVRSDHARRQIRGIHLAPESVSRSGNDVVVPIRPTRPPRDGVARVGAVVPLDQDHRASLAKALGALGWDRATPLVAQIDGHRAVVREGKRLHPWQIPVRVASGRVTLPPTLTGALRVGPGDQVLAITLPDRGELHLAAADALQDITGALTPIQTGAAEPAPVGETEPRRPSRVRAAFAPAT